MQVTLLIVSSIGALVSDSGDSFLSIYPRAIVNWSIWFFYITPITFIIFPVIFIIIPIMFVLIFVMFIIVRIIFNFIIILVVVIVSAYFKVSLYRLLAN